MQAIRDGAGNMLGLSVFMGVLVGIPSAVAVGEYKAFSYVPNTDLQGFFAGTNSLNSLHDDWDEVLMLCGMLVSLLYALFKMLQEDRALRLGSWVDRSIRGEQ